MEELEQLQFQQEEKFEAWYKSAGRNEHGLVELEVSEYFHSPEYVSDTSSDFSETDADFSDIFDDQQLCQKGLTPQRVQQFERFKAVELLINA